MNLCLGHGLIDCSSETKQDPGTGQTAWRTMLQWAGAGLPLVNVVKRERETAVLQSAAVWKNPTYLGSSRACLPTLST